MEMQQTSTLQFDKCGVAFRDFLLNPECTISTFGEYGIAFDIILQIDKFLKLWIQSFYICPNGFMTKLGITNSVKSLN